MSRYYIQDGRVYQRQCECCDRRPVVVIDPEDREQVERLTHTFYAVRNLGEPALAPSRIDNMQAALREFADPKPPKPEEPTGLGAVVEDERGRLWTRCRSQHGRPWRPADIEAAGSHYSTFAALHAVRILSPGYDPKATS